MGDGKKIKNLLSASIFYRVYDVYFASILAIIYKNKTLTNLLLRAQFKLYFDGLYFFDLKNGKPIFAPSYRLVPLHEEINKENKEVIIQLIIYLKTFYRIYLRLSNCQ